MNRSGLYLTLSQNIDLSPLTAKEKANLAQIKNLSEKEYEAIADLIKSHFSIDNNESDIIPYEGIQKKDGIYFAVDKLPPELCKIILKFIKFTNTNSEIVYL